MTRPAEPEIVTDAPTEFRWSPHRYRNSVTGEIETDPAIEHADNGRPYGIAGFLAVTIAPYGDGVQLVAYAPSSWLKPYYMPEWPDREQARAVAHRLLSRSLDSAGDLPRDDLGKVIDRLAEATP